IIRKVGVETGGSNIQFAVNPDDGRMLIIEMNPRVSRSSALASKATGFPIAKIAAKLAIGLTLDEIRNDITQKTPASFEPAIDYCVVKFPRFTFEKFPETEPVLTTQMRSVGEVMAIGRTFRESLQKAVRSLEIDRDGLDFPALTGWGEMGRAARRAFLENNLRRPGPERVWQLAQAFREGFGVEECYELTRIDPWFLRQFRELVALEGEIAEAGAGAGRRSSLPPALLRRAKRDGFSDAAIGRRTGRAEGEIRRERHAAGLQPVYKRVDTCAAEFEAYTPYLYSTYEEECEARPTDRPKVLILGSGPNRIGQGIEFDYCCVHAVQGFAEAGYESIMVNCNPETVSTDYDTSDRLYFEPLTLEDVLAIIETEKPRGVVVQFGGQTPLKLAIPLLEAGAPILGTSPESIDLAEDRRRFSELLRKLRLAQPPGTTATSLAGARDAAVRLGFPLLVRPSYVLGGRAMQVVHDMESLLAYMTEAVRVSPRHPVLIDRFLADAVEVDVDAVSDGERAVVGGVMEHIEEAGIHSGDSACALPPYSLGPDVVEELKRQTRLLARALNVLGLINVQFAVQRRQAYVLEVNPRASRTVPFVSKVTGVPLARIAARVMAGAKLADLGLTEDPPVRHVGVKEAVFPFKKFPGVDVLLGPEMKSTGEVMGLGRDFPSAFLKAQLGAGEKIPLSGTAFVSVRDEDKAGLVPPAQMLVDLGFKLLATEGTHQALATAGVPSERVPKVTEGVRPHCVDRMGAGEVSLVINTTRGRQAILDSYTIRRTALVRGIFYCTTLSAAQAAVRSIAALQEGELGVRSLQEYHGVVRAAARALH
ncbi:MAG: carbamoyl-phosphate synthase large subunit, partial [Nitrospinota bacterium]